MKDINRLNHNIYIGGLGVVLLGFWSVLKVAISLTIGSEKISQNDVFLQAKEDELWLYYLIAAVIFLFLSFFVISFHNLIGLNAMRRAKKKKYRKSYIFWAIVLLILDAIGIPGYIPSIIDDPQNVDSVIAAILVDLTLLFILADIIVSSYKLKKLESKENI